MSNIRFISYTGKYPNLCRGILTVEIDGREYKFGHNYSNYDYETNTFKDEDPNNRNLEAFWSSGGCVCSSNDYSDMWAESGKWKLLKDELPETLEKYGDELIDMFNDNVIWGCCGGCI